MNRTRTPQASHWTRRCLQVLECFPASFLNTISSHCSWQHGTLTNWHSSLRWIASHWRWHVWEQPEDRWGHSTSSSSTSCMRQTIRSGIEQLCKERTCLIMGFAGRRSCSVNAERSTGHWGVIATAWLIQSLQNVWEQFVVDMGSIKGTLNSSCISRTSEINS